jgi:hypothetical protein
MGAEALPKHYDGPEISVESQEAKSYAFSVTNSKRDKEQSRPTKRKTQPRWEACVLPVIVVE